MMGDSPYFRDMADKQRLYENIWGKEIASGAEKSRLRRDNRGKTEEDEY
jgi:hypothetical protein